MNKLWTEAYKASHFAADICHDEATGKTRPVNNADRLLKVANDLHKVATSLVKREQKPKSRKTTKVLFFE